MPHARLTPAMTFLLLTGELADARIHGWVTTAQAGQYNDAPSPEAVWSAHSAELIAMAQQIGFEPYRLTGRKPTGPAFEAWRALFVKQHSY